MKKITIQGIQYPIVFDLQTMLNFEETTGRSFFSSNFESMSLEDRIHLIHAAVKSADMNAKLTIEAIKGQRTFEDMKSIMQASNDIIIMSAEFFTLPEIEKQNDPEQSTEGAKN